MIESVTTVTAEQCAWFALAVVALGTICPRAGFFIAGLILFFYALGRITVT